MKSKLVVLKPRHRKGARCWVLPSRPNWPKQGVLPLPSWGEGWGEGWASWEPHQAGPTVFNSQASAFDPPALTPGPSPAGGRGEQTSGN
ncbi:hypothetical protein CBM2587_A10091 [Cupriavidus taiwanensis]|uniref:Uncharacterized protein n=1 Tax=Cupriavidus taiwanensis TaxID=164546 RepID=A0A975WQL8_9BURK|nr:hypothetical protein CBM2587_A10091 [Cupriavidus taiwanensis]